MCEKCGPGHICAWCMGTEICSRQDVIIAQNQRICDLLERSTGYDNLPLTLRQLAPVINVDYKLPLFESGAEMTWGIFATDCTGVDVQIYMYHPTIVASGNRYPLCEFQGTGTFLVPSGNVTIPANGIIGFRFNALAGGTFAALSVSYNRSEQTGIEWARSQRAGRIG
jgi:hypothetical protein